MKHEQRIENVIARKNVNGFPLVFGFSSEDTKRAHAEKFGMPYDEFCEYVGPNDILFLIPMDDVQVYLSNRELLDYAFEHGFATRKDDPNIAYDRWGVGWEIFGGQGQRPMGSPLDTVEKIRNYEVPSADAENMFYTVERDLSGLKEKGHAVAIGQYYCLFEKAWVLMGYENFWIQCHENRDVVEQLLDKITDHRVRMAERIIEFDVTCGHTGDDFGLQTGPAMSLDLWRTLFKPRLAKIWDVYKQRGIPIIHHSCGDCRLFLDDMIEMGLDVLHPVQSTAMPIEDLRDRFGSRLTFYGGIDCQNVVKYGTPAEVETNVRRTIEVLGSNGGLIVGALNIMADVPVENLRALIDTMHEYRSVEAGK